MHVPFSPGYPVIDGPGVPRGPCGPLSATPTPLALEPNIGSNLTSPALSIHP